MVIGMLLFPVGDAVAKFLSDDYGIFLLSWARLAFGAMLMLPFTLLTAKTLPIIERRLLIEQVVRTVFAVIAIILFVAALARIPLANVVGAYLTAPLFAAIFAAIILREHVSRRAIVAALLGFGGALLIVRPGASMDIGSLYALGAGASFGGFLVATRWAIRDVPPMISVTFQTVFGALLLLPFAAADIAQIGGDALPWLLLMGLGSAGANVLVITALRYAPTNVLAPLVYVEIVGATALGYIVFGDIPAPLTWLGIAVVIGSGLLLLTIKNARAA